MTLLLVFASQIRFLMAYSALVAIAFMLTAHSGFVRLLHGASRYTHAPAEPAMPLPILAHSLKNTSSELNGFCRCTNKPAPINSLPVALPSGALPS